MFSGKYSITLFIVTKKISLSSYFFTEIYHNNYDEYRRKIILFVNIHKDFIHTYKHFSFITYSFFLYILEKAFIKFY